MISPMSNAVIFASFFELSARGTNVKPLALANCAGYAMRTEIVLEFHHIFSAWASVRAAFVWVKIYQIYLCFYAVK